MQLSITRDKYKGHAKSPWRCYLRGSLPMPLPVNFLRARACPCAMPSATYYLKARHGEITRLQLNMGHRSVQLLYSRYVNMAGTTRDMAEKWWQILPD